MLLRIKTAAVFLTVVMTAIFLTSCAVVPTDITELETLPKLTAEQQAMEKALESSAGGKLTLKYPLEGDYRSAFVPRDFDHNGTEQALAFYSLQNGSGTHIAILSKVDGKWKATGNISSDSSDINSISFGDFNGDGHDDIAVGWCSFNSTDISLAVYTETGTPFSKISSTFTEMKTLDMDNDGKTDILLMKLDPDERKAMARLISYRDGKLKEVSNTPLDSTVTSYAGVYSTSLKTGETGIIIDGYKSEKKMITELIYFKNGRLYSPLYNTNNHTVNATMRYYTCKSTDIDKDGMVEIPMPVELPTVLNEKGTNQNWLVRWSAFDTKKGLTPKVSAIMNYTENYYLTYPEKWGTNVTVSKGDSDSVWNFCKWDSGKGAYGDILFTIYVFNEDKWNGIADKSGYQILSERNGTVYLVQIPSKASKDKLALSFDEIKKIFSLLS